jgi:hypothetical protein
MANIVACQTLGEMSTPSRAGAGQSSMQHATHESHSDEPFVLYRNSEYKNELCRATNLSQSGEAVDGAVHSCTLSRDITRTVRQNGTQFMVVGFVLVCSTTFVAEIKLSSV